MSNDNIKFKSSSIPPPKEQTAEKIDSFQQQTPKTEKSNFGPGNSKYSATDNQTNDWKLVTGGGSKYGSLPTMADNNAMGGIAAYCEDLNARIDTNAIPNFSQTFQPKTAFDFFRMRFETMKPMKAADLNTGWKEIPDYQTLKQNDSNTEVIKNYYMNRLGMIKDRLANAETETKTNQNGHIRREFVKLKDFLEHQELFVEDQLGIILREELYENS